MTLPFIEFPRVDEPTCEWADAVLRSGWNFDGRETEHNPERVEQFLEKLVRDNPRRRSDDLSEADWDRLEAILTDYKLAYLRERKRARHEPRPSLSADT